MKNWTKIAEALRPEIPAEDRERLGPALEALENAFRPLAGKLTLEVEPAVVFRAAEDAE